MNIKIKGNQKQTFYLPDEYTQLEFIESSGTQYIDTGYKANQKTEYEVEFSYSSMLSSSNGFVIGSRISSDSENISLTCDFGDTFVGRGNTYAHLSIPTIINQKYKFKVTENSIIRDGTVISQIANNFGDETGTYNVRLFNLNQNGVFTRNFSGKIYNCKIWDNGELVREFIPCKRNGDSILGMYDTVNNVFYTNAGSGTFTAGQEQRVSPNYPASIETVGSNVNEFDKSTVELGFRIDATGSLYASSNYAASDFIPVIPNSTHTINYIAGVYHRTGYYDTNKQFIESNTTDTTFTVPNNCYFIRLSMDKDFIDNAKLEPGGKATPYSPYGMGSVEIENVNKNFIKIQEMNKTEIGLDISTNKNVVNINGTATSGTNIYNFFEDIKLKKGTYTFSFISQNAPAINSCQFVFRDENNAGIVTLNGWGETNAKTVTLEKDTVISSEKSSFYTNKNITFSNTKYELQIEKGESATEIIEPQSQTKIMPIQKEMLEGDYIEDVEHHEWGKYTFTGNENITTFSSVNERIRYVYSGLQSVIKKPTVSTELVGLLCNYYKEVTALNTYNNIEGISVDENGQLIFKNEVDITIEEFKAWLQEQYSAGTPVIVYYKLATPIDLELTEEQEEAVETQSYTYENKTYISTDSIAILEINYGSENIPLGNYIIPKPDSEEVKEKTNFVGYDYMIKFNVLYQDRVTYPISSGDYFEDLCDQVGLEAGNIDFVNSDYMISGNPFTNNEDCRTVLSNIAQLAGGFARIGRDNKVYITSLTNDIRETIDGNNYFTDFSKNNKWGEVNSLVLRISGTEGENTVIQDEESIEENGLTEIVIEDNYFLINQTERQKVITPLWNSLKGLKYLPISTEYYGYPYLDSGDGINILDATDTSYFTYIFNHKFKYNGGFDGEIDTSAMTKTQTAYKNTINNKTKYVQIERKVDKINGEIEDIVEEQTDFSNKLSKVNQDINGITEEVHSLYDFYKEVEGTNEIILDDALPTSIVELIIKPSAVENILYPQTTLYPSNTEYPHKAGDGATVVFSARTRVVSQDTIYPSNTQYPSSQLIPIGDSSTKEFSFYFGEPLRVYNNTCDEFQIIFNEETGICEAKVLRRINYNNGVYTIYNTPQEEFIKEITMELFKGINYVYLEEYTDWNIYAKYIFNNELNKEFAPRVESMSEVRKTADEINLEVSKKVNQDEVIASINLSPEQIKILAKNLQLEGFTSINGNFTIDEQGNMICNDATINGAVIANGENFSVDENGNVICKSATMENVVCENFTIKNSTIQEGFIQLKSTDGNSSFSVTDTSEDRLNSELSASFLNFNSNLDRGVAQIGVDGASGNGFVDVSGNVYASNIASDKRLKENITDSKINAIDILKKIKIKSFDWKANKEHIDAGIIAQEVEEVNKNFVLKRPILNEKKEITDYKYYINELPIISTLIKAIQEQQEIIEKLINN